MRQNEIQNEYRDLCAELGHLTLQKRGIDSRLTEIETQIAKLNKEAGELKAAADADKELEAEVQRRAKKNLKTGESEGRAEEHERSQAV